MALESLCRHIYILVAEVNVLLDAENAEADGRCRWTICRGLERRVFLGIVLASHLADCIRGSRAGLEERKSRSRRDAFEEFTVHWQIHTAADRKALS